MSRPFINVTVNTDAITRLPLNLEQQMMAPETRIAMHTILRNMCDPYVPFDKSLLGSNVDVSDECVHYLQPYAHYMYMGLVYGPNIPKFDANGVLIGFTSIPGMDKYPTGAEINYQTTMHPLATKEWDKAMLRDHRDEFTKQIGEAILNGLHGRS